MVTSIDFKNENVVRLSKWAAFIEIFFPRIEQDIAAARYSQHGPELIKGWKDVIKAFFVHYANSDPNIKALYQLCITDGPNSQGLTVAFEETILAHMERIGSKRSDTALLPIKELEDLLRAEGGTSCRRVVFVKEQGREELPLTQDQSDRLLNAFTPELLSTFSLYKKVVKESAVPVSSDTTPAAETVTWIEQWAQCTNKRFD